MSASSDDKHCVVTFVANSDLKLQPTFTGPPITKDQLYEQTVMHANMLGPQISGSPFRSEHLDDVDIGELLHGWIHPNPRTGKYEMHMQARIDHNTGAGRDIIKAIINDKNDPSPFNGVEMCETSLAHRGNELVEASMVFKGARKGCCVSKLEWVDTPTVQSIKAQKYIPLYPPDAITSQQEPHHTEPCAIYASINSMASHVNVHQKTGGVRYDPSFRNESQPILDLVAGAQQQLQQGGPSAPMHPATAAAAAAESGLVVPRGSSEVEALRRQVQDLEKRLTGGPAGGAPQQQLSPQQMYEKQQHDAVLNGTAPSNGGNSHPIWTSPEYDPLNNLATTIAHGSNMLNNQTRAQVLQSVQSAAAQRIALKEELQHYKAKSEQLEAKVQHYTKDAEKQKRNFTALMKRVVQKSVPNVSESEKADIDAFESNFVNGETDKAMDKLQPILIRASAYMDAMENQSAAAAAAYQQRGNGNVQMHDGDADPQTARQLANIQQMLMYEPQHQTVQASGYSGKRSYAQMEQPSRNTASSATFGVNGMWKGLDSVPGLGSIFDEARENAGTTMSLEDYTPSSKTSRR